MSKPPSEKQAGFLGAFGLTAATAEAAHEEISRILALPVAEQARLRLQRCEDLFRAKEHPQDSHSVLFSAATMLVHGYALSQDQAFPLLREYANRSDQPWSDGEVQYKLNSADKTVHSTPRGYLLRTGESPAAASGPARTSTPNPAMAAAPAYTPRKLALQFDREKLRQVAAKRSREATLEWLANRSAHDPATVSPRRYLELMYPATEKVLLFTAYESQGQALWPRDEVPQAGERGVWYLAQPVTGEYRPNPRITDPKTGKPKMSRRSQEVVTAFRYLVVECDKAKELPAEERTGYIRDWIGLLVQLPLRIEAIYTSGGMSIHALVRIDCRTHREWEEYVAGFMPTLNLLALGGVDPKALTSVRLTRLPNCFRAGKLQKLLYLRPGAEVRPIADLPAARDVAGDWLARYARVVDGYEENTREVRRALRYYGAVNPACRAALRDLEAAVV